MFSRVSVKRPAPPKQKSNAAHFRSTDQPNNPSLLIQRFQRDSASLTPTDMLQLQNTIGNHALSQMIMASRQQATVIQRGNSPIKGKKSKKKGGIELPKHETNPIKLKLLSYIQSDNQGKQVQMVADRILKIIHAFEASDYALTYRLLLDDDFLGSIGHSINKKSKTLKGDDKESLLADVKGEIALGMYFNQSKSLHLPIITLICGQDTSMNPQTQMPNNWLTAGNDASLAEMFLPVLLEEWLHMFQYLSGEVLSDCTKAFAQSGEFQANSGNSPDRWNLNEVDIYAIYRELGWDWLLDDFRGRYKERRAFDQFMGSGMDLNFKFIDDEAPVIQENEDDPFADFDFVRDETGENEKKKDNAPNDNNK